MRRPAREDQNSELVRRLRLTNDTRERLNELGWYHSFRFPDGTEFRGAMPRELLEYRYSRFPLPANLSGKRVLDIGAWDGWFSFEAERRGADVTAIDNVELETFRMAHRKLESSVEYRELDVFDLPAAQLGRFDYVLFLGVFYHLKHPVLALEIVCAATLDTAIVESHVIDAETWEENRDGIPWAEFYERDELGGQLDNWFGPTVGCLAAMCRTAGFARAEVLYAENGRAVLACHRLWDFDAAAGDGPKPKLSYVVNTRRRGINFRAAREEYISWYFGWAGSTPRLEDVRLEIGGFGTPAMHTMGVHEDFHVAMSRLPPGLDPGWYDLRMSVAGSGWSETARIAVDLPYHSAGIQVNLVCDGKTWARFEVDAEARPVLIAVWAEGLTDTADEANVTVLVDGRKVDVDFVGQREELGRQVNGKLAGGLAEGRHSLVVRFGGAESKPVEFTARVRH